MENYLKDLIAILEGLTDHYRSLLDILNEEKNAIIRAKLENIETVRIKKERILSLITAKENMRKDVVEKISCYLGSHQKELTISELARLVEVPFSLKLIQCGAELSKLMHNILAANEVNRSLITQSLRLIRSSINMIIQLVAPPPLYFRTGKMNYGDVCGSVLSSSV